jgi:putative transposase
MMVYIRVPQSLRSDLLQERGIEIDHQTVRYWWNWLGLIIAAEIRGNRVETMSAHLHWRWHLEACCQKNLA